MTHEFTSISDIVRILNIRIVICIGRTQSIGIILYFSLHIRRCLYKYQIIGRVNKPFIPIKANFISSTGFIVF